MHVVSASVSSSHSELVTNNAAPSTARQITTDPGKIRLGGTARLPTASSSTADSGKIRMGACARLPLKSQ